MLLSLATWLDGVIHWFNELWPEDHFFNLHFNVRALLAILIVALVCGSIGSLVVANRMAFFSDALAHCAFAGVALGLLIALLLGSTDEQFRRWIALIMIVFGVGIGVLIAFVKESTSLASDTIIGVFFAGAIGMGGMFARAARGKRYFNLENFLFGDPLSVTAEDILWLLTLIPLTGMFLYWTYNALVFASFSPSLARSRQIRVRLCNYAFIILLALVVNLCLQIVGALLINALLIVPAATAGNLSRNLRQLFWWSIGLSVFTGMGGQYLSWEIRVPDPSNPAQPIQFGIGGTIVVLGVLLFGVSMAVGSKLRGARG